MVLEGLTDLMHGELMRPLEKENILILSGDAQPLDVVGMHELADDILQTLKDEGVTDVITLAAYVGENGETVLGTVTDPESAKALNDCRIPLLRSGAIGGMNGLLAGLAPRYGMRGFCLLATTSGSDTVDVRAASRLLGIPALYTPHGWPAGERMPRLARVAFRLVEKMMARWCDGIVCVCEYEKRFALEKRIAAAEKLVVVYNGVRNVGAELRAKTERTPVRICSVARFDAPKDHRTLLEALALLRETAWEIDLLGDGPQQGEMQRLARELGLGDRARFRGYLPDASGLLAQAQIFVLSSRSEAFPRSILEAMRAGLPVVATDVGGVGEAVTDGVSGRLVPPGSPHALASALRELVESAQLRQSMGKAARTAYEQRFQFEVMAGLTAAVYATVQSRTARLQRFA